MSAASEESNLADRRYVTVVLRVVLDRQSKIAHGELVDVEGNLVSRFVGWRGMTRGIRDWVAHQVRPGVQPVANPRLRSGSEPRSKPRP